MAGAKRGIANRDPFLVGVAISVYQNSGGPGTNWEEFETQKNWLGQPYIEGGDRCGKSSDFWNNYEADIARVASLNSNCFRLSLEWSRIEPTRGHLDSEGIARYHAILDCCDKHKLEPMVTLHHFAHPLWFERMGAFEKAANIPVFVEFVKAAYREFGSRARLWATFNEINVMTFCGYLYGHFPPAKIGNFTLAGRHFLNMLRAHTAAYKAIKALPGGKGAKVGIVHNFLQYRPKNPRSCSAAYIKPLCALMEKIWGTGLVIEYLQSGMFNWNMPFGASINLKEPEKPGCDWIGINYYGRVVLDWKFSTTCLPRETMTDMPFPLYAPGLYEGCKEMSVLGVPLYITETGVADHRDVLRPEMFDTYFAQVERAVREGLDVRGVMYWTLVDNWEWAHGFHKQFGLYRWANGDGKKRGEVASTALLAQIYKALPDRIETLRAPGRPEL